MSKQPTRERYPTRSILLRTEMQAELVAHILPSLPRDDKHPLEILIREQVKKRSLDANARMWAGPLGDYETQAYDQGRTYSAPIWHEHLKELFLPEEYDPELCTDEDYQKWDFTPGGRRILVGSTTELTPRGHALYVLQIEAHGATGYGIQFTEYERKDTA